MSLPNKPKTTGFGPNLTASVCYRDACIMAGSRDSATCCTDSWRKRSRLWFADESLADQHGTQTGCLCWFPFPCSFTAEPHQGVLTSQSPPTDRMQNTTMDRFQSKHVRGGLKRPRTWPTTALVSRQVGPFLF